MSLEQKIEDLTAAVLVLAKAYSEHASAPAAAAPKKSAKAAAKPAAEATAEPAADAAINTTTASTPAPTETTAAPQAEAAPAASSEEADRELVRARLVSVQNEISRDRALQLLESVGEAKTIGKVPPKNFKKLIAACDVALAEQAAL